MFRRRSAAWIASSTFATRSFLSQPAPPPIPGLLPPPMLPSIATHTVENQVPLYHDMNLYTSNRRLRECIDRFSLKSGLEKEEALAKLTNYGAYVGSEAAMEDAYLSNQNTPVFTPFDKQGRRIDSVTFHESYHRLMGSAMEGQVPSYAFQEGTKNYVVRCALSYLHYQLEQGTSCPLTMTFACVPVLRAHSKDVPMFAQWTEKLTTAAYDNRDVHISLKRSAMCGMSMTEKQGGSDVRSNTTFAVPAVATNGDAVGSPYYLTGHKWFTSAPMCDGFLTLAQVPKTDKHAGGMSCFLVPRWLSPEQRNSGLRFQRLKNKMGDKSNASSEVEYHNAVGYLVGAVGRGVPTIIEMVNNTRLDCLVGSSALMQAATFHAVHHATHRRAFGSTLREKPVMEHVLYDLCLQAEAATALSMRVASMFGTTNPLGRFAVAIGKYYACKRCPSVVYEALECIGGNGYVEDFPLARYFRQSPLNAIWEGSGNVIAADVFRALQGSGDLLLGSFLKEVEGTGYQPLVEAARGVVGTLAKKDPSLLNDQRLIVERLALILQASSLYYSNPDIGFEQFVKSRITQPSGLLFEGTHSSGVSMNELKALVDRHVSCAEMRFHKGPSR